MSTTDQPRKYGMEFDVMAFLMKSAFLPTAEGAQGKSVEELTEAEKMAIAVCACTPTRVSLDFENNSRLIMITDKKVTITAQEDGGFKVEAEE